MTGVSCYVDSCEYWGTGQVCKADQIVVDNSRGRKGGSYSMEVGEFGQGGGDARTSGETMCQTFKPKSGGGSQEGHGSPQSRSYRR